MNTKLATTRIRIQQWREIIKSRAESWLSINDFCEENNLSLNQYYYWLRKVREAAIEKSGMHFVEIKQENPSFSCSIGSIQIQLGRASINVCEGTSKELLRMVLEVVEDVQ